MSLPPAARRRIAAATQASLWAAAVQPGEEAALHSVGFEPAGIVTARIPSWPFVYQYPSTMRSSLARSQRSSLSPNSPTGTNYPLDDALTAKRAGGFTRDYVEGATGGILPNTGFSWQRVVHEERDRQLFRACLDSLRQQAQGLAGHGIVAINVTWDRRLDLDFDELHAYEINAVGLAVRATDTTYGGPLFTAGVSGPGIAALLRSGFAPSELAFGTGIVKAAMGNRTRKHLRSLGLAEVSQFSEAVHKSLSIATIQLERNTAASGDLVVGCHPELSFERTAGAGLECRTRITGTAVRRFAPPEASDPLTIMKLHD